MKNIGDSFELSATDLVEYLNCHHLVCLDRAVANDALSKPKVWDPLLQILSERGAAHERDYIEHLTTAGLDVVRIDGVEVTHEAVAETRATMQRGVPVIAQAALAHQGWNGLVGSPQIFEAECRTPRQIQLPNAFCRYLEMAK